MKKLMLIGLSLFAMACTNTPSGSNGGGAGGGAGHPADNNAFNKAVQQTVWKSGCKKDDQGMEHVETMTLGANGQGDSIFEMFAQPGCQGGVQNAQQASFNYQTISTDASGSVVRITTMQGNKDVKVVMNGNTLTVDGVAYTRVGGGNNQGEQNPVNGGNNGAAAEPFVQLITGNWQSDCQVQDGTNYREILMIGGNGQLTSVIIAYAQAQCAGQGQENNRSVFAYTITAVNGNTATVQLQTDQGAKEATVSVNGNTMKVGQMTYTKF